MKQNWASFAVLALLFSYFVVGVEARPSDRYPNEILGFELHNGARWASLTPLTSRMADVRQILGPPDEARDLANYSRRPYSGDGKWLCAVWTYTGGEWTILIYFDSYFTRDRDQPFLRTAISLQALL
ncbi:MAG: hypothetical protein IPF82_08030 [Blastocatellia bacterium]|nr:hypothetical protein [Blastocatellia bacterium]